MDEKNKKVPGNVKPDKPYGNIDGIMTLSHDPLAIHHTATDMTRFKKKGRN